MSEIDAPLELDGAALSRLSPLWLRLDAALQVEAMSPAAARVLGADAVGRPLGAVVQVRRPVGAASAADLLARRGQVSLALHAGPPPAVGAAAGGLPLQGVALRWGDGLALLMSPVAESAQALRAVGLQVGDLGPLDPTSAYLMRDQLLRATLDDATRLAAELRVRNAELEDLRNEADRARAAAERLAASRADFLSTMSHELRTPLNGVIGTISLLGLQPLEPPAARLHTVLERSARGLRSIVDDVLDLARLEAGRLELRAAPFELIGLMEDVVGEFAGMAQARGLQLQTEACTGTAAADDGAADDGAVRGGAVWLNGDERRLRQVLSNLVSNAIKFTPEGGVWLRATVGAPEGSPAEPAELLLAVDDSGPGVAPELREAIFDAFRQVDSSARRVAGGTGLGLAICRQLAQVMGASLLCLEAPEGGARFALRLRLARAEAPVAEGPTTEVHVTRLLRLDGLRLLVAEDNPVNQMVAEELLSSRGAHVTLANDGEEAVALVAQHEFDVVLMDLMMPRLDGLAATRALLALPGRAHTVVLAMSASVMPADHDACIAAGMRGAVPKPLDLNRLCELIREAAGR